MKSLEVTHASYWKNGSLKNLTSTLDGETTDVFTSGNNVYFSGAHGNYNKGILAAYWKNGKITKVTKTKTYGLEKIRSGVVGPHRFMLREERFTWREQ